MLLAEAMRSTAAKLALTSRTVLFDISRLSVTTTLSNTLWLSHQLFRSSCMERILEKRYRSGRPYNSRQKPKI